MWTSNIEIPIVIVAVLASFFSINLIVSVMLSKQIKRQRHELEALIRVIADDVRVLYETGAGMEKSIDKLSSRMRLVSEKQEHLTLHEPGQQAYRTAVSMLKNGVSVADASARSGLSKGEVDLLLHLQGKKTPETSGA